MVDAKAGREPKRAERRPDPSAVETGMAGRLFDRLVLPVADEKDAASTCRAVSPYVTPSDIHLVVVPATKQNPGYLDTLPQPVAARRAESIFSIVRDYVSDTPVQVSADVRYGPNVTEDVLSAAEDTEPSK